MTTKAVLLLSSFASSVCSWSYYPGPSPGLLYDRNPEQAQVLGNASLNPNITTSFPVTLAGDHNITFRVNVTELSVAGADTSISEPRAVLTTYDVTYPEGSSYNDTFETPGPACFATAHSFAGSITYKASDDGDCSDALGEECTNALKGFTPDCDTSFYAPPQCRDAFEGVAGFGQFTSSSNGSNPLNIYADSSMILSPKDSESRYNDAAQRMWFALFRTGDRPAVPVCVRPSSGAEVLKAGAVMWSAVAAATAAVWMAV